jgi:hypothetical protein
MTRALWIALALLALVAIVGLIHRDVFYTGFLQGKTDDRIINLNRE